MHYRCKGCGKAISINQVGRRRRVCEGCQRGENALSATITRQTEFDGKNASQAIDIVGLDCGENHKSGSARNRRRSWQGLTFEEWPPRPTKNDRCVTYKLTDGKQINTGYGRTSQALGYVMEVVPGKWMARVNERCSEPLPLHAAKNAAVSLYRSKDKGEPRDWIDHLNKVVVRLLEERLCPALDAKSLRQPIVDLVGSDRDQVDHIVSVECHDDTALLVQRPVPSALLVYAAEPNPYLAQIEKVPSAVMPDIPAFLDRRKHTSALAA
jgi:hypothetical protein